MVTGQKREFVTDLYRTHAARTYGRRGTMTLRVTGLEPVLREATKRNLAVIEKRMPAAEFQRFKEERAGTPDVVWKKVVELGLEKDQLAKRVITMSLGNPSRYDDYPPNRDLYECLGQISSDPAKMRVSSGYTASFGYPPLLRKLQRVNLSDPQSIRKNPDKFKDVRVYMTTGSSFGSGLVMGPMLLTPEHVVCLPDWTYISHMAAAFARNAHVESYDCRDDGRPDVKNLEEALRTQQRDRRIRVVVFTPIGNPNGATMTEADIVEHLRTVEKCTTDMPILTVIDVAYEAFRRDGKPLDPIEIAIDNNINTPIAVLDSGSKGLGVCGWRLGKTAIHWPEKVFPDYRHDFFLALENDILPTLGVVGMPEQLALDMFLDRLSTDPEVMARTVEFFERRRKLINENLLHMATELGELKGRFYMSPYYLHSGRRRDVDPDTLASFYLQGGFTKLSERNGSGHNQVVSFGEYALETTGVPIVDCVPSQSFLPRKRWEKHPAMMRVTGLTNEEETEAFLGAVTAFAKFLG